MKVLDLLHHSQYGPVTIYKTYIYQDPTNFKGTYENDNRTLYTNSTNGAPDFHIQVSNNAKRDNSGVKYYIYKKGVNESSFSGPTIHNATHYLYAFWLTPEAMAYVYNQSFSQEGTYQIHGKVYSNDSETTFNDHDFGMWLYIDNTKPTIDASNKTYGEKLSFVLKDSFTGVAGYAVTTSNTEPTSWTTTGLTNYPKNPGEITDSIVRNAGTYYIWVKDRSGNVNSTQVSISKKSVEVKWGTTTTFTYNGNDQAPTASASSGVDEETINLTRTTGKNAGNYTSTASISSVTGGNESKDNYILTGTTKAFTINKANISPTCTMSGYTYAGTMSTPSVTDNSGSGTVTYYYNTSNSTSGGTAWSSVSSATYLNAGTYYMYAKIGATNNYNGATTATVQFTISKAAGTISFATAIVNKTYLDTSYTQTVTKTGDGTVTYSSNNTSVATVNSSSGAVSIVGAGTTTITATATDGTNYKYSSRTATYTLNVVYVVNEASSLIMKWKIPAGGANVKLPIPSNAANNYIVDWGDSSTVELVTNNNFYMHTYTNTTETEYTVKISGVVKSFGYRYSQVPTATNAYSDYLTYTQYLTEVVRFGELSATGYGFAYCRNLTKVTADAKPETFASVPTMQYMFYGSDKLASIDLGNLDTTNVSSMDSMFYSCSSLVSAKFDEWKNAGGWNTQNVSSTRAMFDGCSKLEVVHLNGINTANVTTMESMFANCTKLRELDMSNCDTQNVETMYKMFYGCSSLVGDSASKFDVSNWNTSNVRIMESMFENCSSLTKLNVDNWNVGSVQNMRSLFRKCQSLNSLNVSDWKTISVMYMTSTFNSCSSLTTIDVSEWDTRSVTSMDYMFYNCSNLEYLNLDIWSTEGISSGANINYMFSDCTNLKDVLLGTRFARFDGNNMFHNCSSLRAVISLYNSVMTLSTTERADLSNGKLYVPSVEIEQAYEANRNFANAFGTGSEALSKVEPIVQVKGDNPKIVGFGEVYTINQDEGVYVAGYSNKTDISSNPYAIYGFSIDTTGFPIDTEVLGEYIISYKLNKNN